MKMSLSLQLFYIKLIFFSCTQEYQADYSQEEINQSTYSNDVINKPKDLSIIQLPSKLNVPSDLHTISNQDIAEGTDIFIRHNQSVQDETCPVKKEEDTNVLITCETVGDMSVTEINHQELKTDLENSVVKNVDEENRDVTLNNQQDILFSNNSNSGEGAEKIDCHTNCVELLGNDKKMLPNSESSFSCDSPEIIWKLTSLEQEICLDEAYILTPKPNKADMVQHKFKEDVSLNNTVTEKIDTHFSCKTATMLCTEQISFADENENSCLHELVTSFNEACKVEHEMHVDYILRETVSITEEVVFHEIEATSDNMKMIFCNNTELTETLLDKSPLEVVTYKSNIEILVHEHMSLGNELPLEVEGELEVVNPMEICSCIDHMEILLQEYIILANELALELETTFVNEILNTTMQGVTTSLQTMCYVIATINTVTLLMEAFEIHQGEVYKIVPENDIVHEEKVLVTDDNSVKVLMHDSVDPENMAGVNLHTVKSQSLALSSSESVFEIETFEEVSSQAESDRKEVPVQESPLCMNVMQEKTIENTPCDNKISVLGNPYVQQEIAPCSSLKDIPNNNLFQNAECPEIITQELNLDRECLSEIELLDLKDVQKLEVEITSTQKSCQSDMGMCRKAVCSIGLCNESELNCVEKLHNKDCISELHQERSVENGELELSLSSHHQASCLSPPKKSEISTIQIIPISGQLSNNEANDKSSSFIHSIDLCTKEVQGLSEKMGLSTLKEEKLETNTQDPKKVSKHILREEPFIVTLQEKQECVDNLEKLSNPEQCQNSSISGKAQRYENLTKLGRHTNVVPFDSGSKARSECSSDEALFYEAEESDPNKKVHVEENIQEVEFSKSNLSKVVMTEEVHDETFYDALDTLDAHDKTEVNKSNAKETVKSNNVAKCNFYASFHCKNMIQKTICDARQLKSCYSVLDDIMNNILITHDCIEQVKQFLNLHSTASQEIKDLALSVIINFKENLATETSHGNFMPAIKHSKFIPGEMLVEENFSQVRYNIKMC
jgi:hypothetical protein